MSTCMCVYVSRLCVPCDMCLCVSCVSSVSVCVCVCLSCVRSPSSLPAPRRTARPRSSPAHALRGYSDRQYGSPLASWGSSSAASPLDTGQADRQTYTHRARQTDRYRDRETEHKANMTPRRERMAEKGVYE